MPCGYGCRYTAIKSLMYLDFEDHRPDTPRVPTPISRREGVAWSFAFHLLLLVIYLLLPADWFAPPPAAATAMLQNREPIRYVQMMPLVDRSAPPKRPADQSDIDRRSATIERAPKPENTDPYSRGDSPEKILGAPEEKAAGPDTLAPSPSRDREPLMKVLPENAILPPQQRAGGSLGDSLRDLQRYLQDQNFNNQRGGLTDNDPDIQFDAKGIDFGPWLRRFVAQVKSNWFVPEAAMALKGRVVLQFNVQRDGSITDLTIAQPSSVESFTKSAYNAMRRSNPTMPLPPDYPAPMASFTVTFHYNEGRNLPQ
jgi:TonB family protein